MEQEMVWVTFVGGPLDGQSRRLHRSQTHLNAYPMTDLVDFDPTAPVPEMVSYVTYKIERHWEGKPGSHREWFTGVLI